jgi:hypothetical protein
MPNQLRAVVQQGGEAYVMGATDGWVGGITQFSAEGYSDGANVAPLNFLNGDWISSFVLSSGSTQKSVAVALQVGSSIFHTAYDPDTAEVNSLSLLASKPADGWMGQSIGLTTTDQYHVGVWTEQIGDTTMPGGENEVRILVRPFNHDGSSAQIPSQEIANLTNAFVNDVAIASASDRMAIGWTQTNMGDENNMTMTQSHEVKVLISNETCIP